MKWLWLFNLGLLNDRSKCKHKTACTPVINIFGLSFFVFSSFVLARCLFKAYQKNRTYFRDNKKILRNCLKWQIINKQKTNKHRHLFHFLIIINQLNWYVSVLILRIVCVWLLLEICFKFIDRSNDVSFFLSFRDCNIKVWSWLSLSMPRFCKFNLIYF